MLSLKIIMKTLLHGDFSAEMKSFGSYPSYFPEITMTASLSFLFAQDLFPWYVANKDGHKFNYHFLQKKRL